MDLPVHGGKLHLQRAVVAAVEGQVEVRPWRRLQRIAETQRRVGEQRVERRVLRCAFREHRFARGDDRGRERGDPDPRTRAGREIRGAQVGIAGRFGLAW